MSQEPGTLHLGVALDASTRKPTEEGLRIPSHQLTTHGVIVGMTGSGKTGLGIVLLEEVLRAGVPALILDPKGDMGNLALTFPDLAAADFEPWVDASQAAREGLSTGQLAERTAEAWRKGLAGAGITGEDVRSLRSGVDVRIVTPGSTTGVPLNVLGDLSAPEGSWEEQGEALREEIEGLVSGLLVLAGLEADPLTSREHILLANLVEHAWRDGRGLDLATLLAQIQEPPMRRLGVFELDAFFPAKDRMALAMRLNGLLASPSFAEWLQGDPADVDTLLRAPDGRPRATIVYMAHLSDTERQFVVTLLLSKMVTWMRRQAGTSDLRALVYVDELFGFAPPTAEPPSKKPLLTLFKQARAHGVGLVVATQNPVDMDYKLMSNAGTWMVGRLQTERDKARIVEALRSASGDVDVAAWDALLGELGKRQFVLKSAAAAEPRLFTSRWAMSYLRGPLTRPEIVRLRASSAEAGAPAARDAAPRSAAGRPAVKEAAATSAAAEGSPVAPRVATDVPVSWLDAAAPWARALGAGAGGPLQAGIAMRVRLLFDEERAGLRHEEEWESVLYPVGAHPRPEDAVSVDYDDRDFRDAPPAAAAYAMPDAPLAKAELFRTLRKEMEDHLFRSRTLTLWRNDALKLFSRVGESEDDFRKRCLEAAEDVADSEAAKLRDRYEKRLEAARDRKVQAERKVRELQTDVGTRRQQEVVAGAGEILSLFLGGRRRMRSLSGAASRRSQTVRTQERLQSASEKMEDHDEAIRGLEDELASELQDGWAKWEKTAGSITTVEIPLEKTDVRVEEMLLFWG
ncbi:MAG: ATP-binding protein [Longimicrobiales bacterium]